MEKKVGMIKVVRKLTVIKFAHRQISLLNYTRKYFCVNVFIEHLHFKR